MPFALEPRYLEIQREALELAAEAEPYAVEADAMSSVHDGIRDLLAASGLWGLTVPAAYGGRFESVDPLAVCVAREALMATSSHLDSLFALQGIGSYGISVAGSERQRAEWLPKVASGEVLAGLALTEPDAGSDLRAVATAVSGSGDDLQLSGEKAFISNGGVAAFYTVFAREGNGHSVFLVPADRPGLEIVAAPELIAPHVLSDLRLDEVPVTPEDRLGEPGKGFDVLLATLSVFRVSVAGASLGLAQAALEEAARHTGTREQFGRPLARLGAVAERLADSWTELEAARLLTYRAAELARTDPAGSLSQSSMAKLFASETAGRVVDRAVQVMGRFGLIADAKIERLYRQARPMRIYEGASEVLRLGISRALVEQVLEEEG
ncbi:MAG TPA: acyl-CoA dehydrogenase family protein [Solirubrobacterales bacterium]|nr:acyl-CoA dehydrogenase family protein [Solirubrobacterales bacterium]